MLPGDRNYFKLFHIVFKIDSDFERVFFAKEYKALLGRKKHTIIGLHVILILTYVALGFAVGSLENLNVKMNNPFTNWVDLPVREQYISEQMPAILNRYDDHDNASEYFLNNIEGYTSFTLNVYNLDFNLLENKYDTLNHLFWGRTLTADGTLLERILDVNTDNAIWLDTRFKKPESEEDDFSLDQNEIIISSDLARVINLKNYFDGQTILIHDANTFYDSLGEQYSVDNVMPLKVVAVVKNLPGFAHFITLPNTYNILNNRRDGVKDCIQLLNNNTFDNNYCIVFSHKDKEHELEQFVNDYFQDMDPRTISEAEFIVGARTYTQYLVSIDPSIPPSFDKLFNFILEGKDRKLLANGAYVGSQGNYCNEVSSRDFHYIAFNFGKLDKVKEFKEDIFTSFGIPIEMSQVESKENFVQISRLTIALSFVLIAFGIISVLLFINNVLRTHLISVKSNLGTFLAFGLNGEFLKRIYLKIIFIYVGLALCVTIGLCAIVHIAEHIVNPNDYRFNIFNWWVLLTTLLILGSSLMLSARTIKTILLNTPGNLIYGR